jgi:hypothetical protein
MVAVIHYTQMWTARRISSAFRPVFIQTIVLLRSGPPAQRPRWVSRCGSNAPKAQALDGRVDRRRR